MKKEGSREGEFRILNSNPFKMIRWPTTNCTKLGQFSTETRGERFDYRRNDKERTVDNKICIEKTTIKNGRL